MERRGIRHGGRWTLGVLSVMAALPVLALAFADDPGESAAPAPPAASAPRARSEGIGELMNLDLDQLAAEPVVRGGRESNLAAPSSQLDAADLDGGEANTLSGLLTQTPSVSAARLSALNLDPRVRGYHASQINASANGVTQLKARVDLDSLFSQIDPGIVDRVTVVDGPYTSLYGPGFAFLAAELLPTPPFGDPQTHFSTSFYYGTNGQNLYNRDNVLSSGRDCSVLLSYGIRASNDYTPGGGEPHIPSSYNKWDGLLAVSYKTSETSRLEFQTLRTDINNLELPGVAYDIRSSVNDQFNLRYVVQQDPQGPQQLVLQSWWNQTDYRGDALNFGKQWTFIQPFYTHFDAEQTAANLVGVGDLRSLGVRGLRTFGDKDDVQWTVGADWRRYEQRYQESDYTAGGELIYGRVFGVPKSQMDDIGLLTDLTLPMSERLSLSVGGRVDYTAAHLDTSDPIIAHWYASGLTEPNYTLGMAYASGKLKLDDEYTLRAGTGFAMRPPNLTELYVSEPFVPVARFGSSYVDGLSTLRSEYDLQFDLGLSRKTERTTWALRGFYSLVWNYIEPVPAYVDPSVMGTGTHVLGRDFRYFPPDYRTDLGTPGENADENMAGYQYENLGLATLFGADFYVERKMNDRLTVFGTMAYVCGINETPMAFYQSPEWHSPSGQIIRYPGTDGLPGIYPFNGTLGVRLHAPQSDRWMLECLGRFVAPQDQVAVVLSETPSAGFAVFDLRGYYRLSQRVRLVMSLQNLLNKDYSEPGSLAIRDYAGRMVYLKEPGFNGVFGVEARF